MLELIMAEAVLFRQRPDFYYALPGFVEHQP
jgi:hypothetical protein